jgi:neutral trehalase
VLIRFAQVSQPPLLSMMIRAVYGKTHDQTLLKRAMPILLREYAFWTSGGALYREAGSR